LDGALPFHQEADPSFTLFEGSHFHCFGCGAHGDVFAFLMRFDGIDFREACNRVAAETGMAPPPTRGNKKGAQREDWQPILPVPPEAPRPSECLLRCDLLHEYFDPEDRLLLYVRRNERKSGRSKQFNPLTYGRLNGRLGWHAKAPPAPRPLYRLSALSHALPDATVLLVEGEKAAEAAQRMFPDHVAMT
jgi:putative DNA primase/helicase